MIFSFFRVSIRSFLQQKYYSFLNIFGLALGVACALLVMAFVRDDLTWDSFQKNSGRIYRINRLINLPDNVLEHNANVCAPIAPYLKENLPEVEQFTRLYWTGRFQLDYEGKKRYEDAAFSADSSFFDIFTYPLITNNRERILHSPDAIVLRDDVARFYFGDEDPLGKTLVLDDSSSLSVTGVYSIPNPGSFFQPNVIRPLVQREHFDDWNFNGMQSFVLMRDNSDVERVYAGVESDINSYTGEETAGYYLQPFHEIHMASDHISGQVNWDPGNREQVLLYLSVAVLVVLIASINYTNLTTARVSQRTREVGLRKTIGANREQLILQFYGESAITVIASILIGSVLAEISSPLIENLAQRQIDIGFTQLNTILGLGFITLVLTLLAGSFPAIMMSSFRPVEAIKGDRFSSNSFGWFRRILITFQFSGTLLLLIFTGIMFVQMHYVSTYDLGFFKKNMLLIRFESDTMDRFTEVLNSMEGLPGVTGYGPTNGFPGYADPEGVIIPEGKNEELLCHFLGMSKDAAQVFGLDIVRGRWFDPEVYPYDLSPENSHKVACVINECFADQVGWDNPVGKILRLPDEHEHFEVVGVIKDIHQRSLREKIQPMVVLPNTGYYQIAASIDMQNESEALAAIDAVWSSIVPDREISRFFYEQDIFTVRYNDDERSLQLLTLFTIMAIFVALTGLTGLASFIASKRMREMGVRKILGATAFQLVGLLQREFIVLILIANIISWPIAWLLSTRWLHEFVYRIDYPYWIFPFAGMLLLAIAISITTWIAYKAATVNPAKILRHE